MKTKLVLLLTMLGVLFGIGLSVAPAAHATLSYDYYNIVSRWCYNENGTAPNGPWNCDYWVSGYNIIAVNDFDVAHTKTLDFNICLTGHYTAHSDTTIENYIWGETHTVSFVRCDTGAGVGVSEDTWVDMDYRYYTATDFGGDNAFMCYHSQGKVVNGHGGSHDQLLGSYGYTIPAGQSTAPPNGGTFDGPFKSVNINTGTCA